MSVKHENYHVGYLTVEIASVKVFVFPDDEHAPNFVKCPSQCLILLKIVLNLQFHILIEVVYTDIPAHWYFSSNLATSAY